MLKNKLNHVALIMDGNQRWAKKNNKEIKRAYQKGIYKINDIIDVSIKKKNFKYIYICIII